METDYSVLAVGHDGANGATNIRIAPKTLIFYRSGNPIKFVNQMQDFWTAVQPARSQT